MAARYGMTCHIDYNPSSTYVVISIFLVVENSGSQFSANAINTRTSRLIINNLEPSGSGAILPLWASGCLTPMTATLTSSPRRKSRQRSSASAISDGVIYPIDRQ
jgi:hypothetical protein